MIRGRTRVPIKAISLNGVALRNIQVFTIASPTSRVADVDEVGDEADGVDCLSRQWDLTVRALFAARRGQSPLNRGWQRD